MSGHSKWANIKHKKGRTDEKRGKEFTKVAKEITIAVKAGGGADPETNAKLKLAVQKAKAINLPNENIQRAIKKGAGEAGGEALEEFFYEGYAPGGVAVMLEIATDNRNRTAPEIRHLFSKNGGNLGETGCVGWMFKRAGIINVATGKLPGDEEEFMLQVLELGADDIREADEVYEIITPADQFLEIKEAMEKEGYVLEDADWDMVPQNMTEVTDLEVARKVIKLIDLLEDNDDVQNVYTNMSIPDELMEKLS
ncbi:MAG TPA: YebC/PmpR family DNA-binding transcriptional regulator [Syntrophomonadaceae bacterium]|nr:YebC/PmpR family DNA-binding transcriptional regulator [Syntrophomonadaceae bacterium]